MALSNSTQNLLRTQYWDDWYASDADTLKLRGDDADFHRILFRPRYAVQSRELTQIQTLLQGQIERYGQSAFRNGEAVIGGEVAVKLEVVSGKVQATDSNVAALFDRTTDVGLTVFQSTANTVKANIVQYESADEGNSADTYLLFNYLGNDTFTPGSTVQAVGAESLHAVFNTGVNAADVFSNASVAVVNEGVYFVSGFFVRVKKQTIVINPISSTPTARIGFEVIEEVIDEEDESLGDTLLDPANQSAPGAHRFRIRLQLAKRSLDASLDGNFIQLLEIENGVVKKPKPAAGYVRTEDLYKILARRTYDESGNYIVRAFTPMIDVDPTSDEHFLLSLGPGKAYVQGVEVETTEPIKKQLRKGRVTDRANTRSIPTSVGNFVRATRVAATNPDLYFANTSTVDVHSLRISSIPTTSNVAYWNSRIGSAKVRTLETYSVPNNPADYANNSVYNLHFYDLTFDTFTGNVTSGSVSGNTVSASIAVGNGFPASVNDALVGVTIVLGGSGSPVTGTYTIAGYAANATFANVTFREFLPTVPNGNTTYRLLFRPQDVSSFALYDAAVTATNPPYSNKLKFQADVAPEGRLGGVPTGKALIYDTNNNRLLFQIPEQFVEPGTLSTDSAIFTSWVKSNTGTSTFAGANVNYQVAVQGSSFTFPVGSSVLSAAQLQEILVITDKTDDGGGHGQVIQFIDTPASGQKGISNVYFNQSGPDYIINFTYNYGSTPSTATRPVVAFAKATVVGHPTRSKTLIVGNTTAAFTNSAGSLGAGQTEFYNLNAVAGFSYTLRTADVHAVRKVLYKSSNTEFSNSDMASATDVTSFFVLDNGQRDNAYEYSKLTVQSGASAIIKQTGRLMVVFDWFQHTGRGYATVDSYLSETNIVRGLTYDTIPDYTSPKTGHTVNLRDLIDFRPVRSNYEALNAASMFIDATNEGTYSNTTYLTSTGTAEAYLFPEGQGTWIGSYDYYLGRIDKIAIGILNGSGVFQVIEGEDATNPRPPSDGSDTLLMFQLDIPPYTLVDADGVPKEVSLKTFSHKRFTMNDLSKLDDRVAHLEYYTALNSLEQITHGTPITDADDNERFKNGILVDSFHDGGVADVKLPEFSASIDTLNRELRCGYRSDVMQFAADVLNSTSHDVSVVGDMVIPTYTTSGFITQSLATHAISVNPFDIGSFYGAVKLSPAVDVWKDVTTRPAQVIDLGGPSEAWIAAEQPAFVSWGAWEQTWTGVTASTPRATWSVPPGWTEDRHAPNSMEWLLWNDVETSTNYARQGTAYEYVVTPSSASLGNRVVDTSIVYYMRPRDIVFAADGLKPKSNLYPFFDNTNVLNYVQQSNQLQLTPVSTSSPITFQIGQTIIVRKPVTGTSRVTTTSNVVTSNAASFFSHEIVPGQMILVKQGATEAMTTVASVSSNSQLTTTGTTLAANLDAATLYTLTPVVIADVATRYVDSATKIEYTLMVVRASQDAGSDSTVPYPITAGPLSPDKHVFDAGTSTVGAEVLVPASTLVSTLQTVNVVSANCRSGVVRAFDIGSATIRFDTDVNPALITVGTPVYFVRGGASGSFATIATVNTASQTATLSTNALDIVPNETVYSLGQPVADGFINGSTIAGRAGTFAGVFHLPSVTFPTGKSVFRLTDSPTNTPASATTSAEAHYEASGLAVTQQETSVTTRSLGLRRAGPRSESFTVRSQVATDFQTQYYDPLAQTFLVDGKAYPQGVFITSLDLCFASVPEDDVPVVVELRPVVNGYPSSTDVVPCVSADGMARVSLRRDQVRTSTTPSFNTPVSITTFTFAAPVHLMPGREYAVVIRSDSNAYTVYTAELSQEVIGGAGTKVAKQAYAGSFFKSQNASTWSESPFEDLMFRLNRAVWNASATAPLTGVLVARGVAPAGNTAFDSFEFYGHDAQFGAMTGVVYQLDLKPISANNNLDGQVAVRYSVFPNEWRLLSARSMVQGFGGDVTADNAGRPLPALNTRTLGDANTATLIATLATSSPDVAPYLDMKKVNLVHLRHISDNLGAQASQVVINNPGAGFLVTSLAATLSCNTTSPIINTSATLASSLQTGDTLIIGSNVEVIVQSVNSTAVIATANVSVTRAANVAHRYGTVASNNAVVLTISGGEGTGAAGYARIGADGRVANVVISVAGSGYAGTPTIAQLQPTAFANVAQANAVFTYTSELSASLGTAANTSAGATRYITRSVTLADGFDARDIHVVFDAYRPRTTTFHVYYKVLSSGADTQRFEDQPWRLMVEESDSNQFSTKANQFKEFRFSTPNHRALDGTSDTADKFKTFAVKIVFASSDTVDLPRIANFRAIALDE